METSLRTVCEQSPRSSDAVHAAYVRSRRPRKPRKVLDNCWSHRLESGWQYLMYRLACRLGIAHR